MKKTLLLSLFCVTLATSIIGQGINGYTKQANNKAVTPTIGKREKMINQFYVDDGGGGGGGSSSLPVHNEISNDLHNDRSYRCEYVDNKGIIKGKIITHDSAYDRANSDADEIDQDWFRFSVKTESNYSFSFSYPNSSYYYELYRFMNNDARTSGTSTSHSLLYSSYANSSSYKRMLCNGTYYLRVTCRDKSMVVPNREYSLTYDYTIKDTTSLVLNNSLLNSNGVVVWQNDNIPYEVDRWNQKDQVLCRYIDDPRKPTPEYKYGFIDPVFMTNDRWNPNGSRFEIKKDRILDSIMYVSGKSALSDCKEYLYELRNILSGEEYQEKIEALQIENSELIVDAITGALKIIVSVIVKGTTIGRVYSTFTLMVSTANVINSLGKFFSFDKNGTEELMTIGDIRDNLRGLYDKCDEILRYSPNIVLRIPRYGYLHTEQWDTYSANSLYGKEVKYSTSIFLPNPRLFPDDYFQASKGISISSRQYGSNYYISGTYTGTLKTYRDFEDFWDRENPITIDRYEVWRSGCDLDYRLVKRKDNKNYLYVHNYCSVDILLGYNKTAVTDAEASYFNFKADSYELTKVMSGTTTKICLENREYCYVREETKQYAFKISVGSDGWTAISNMRYFDMDHLKVAIVGRESTFTTSAWIIRIRNLTPYDLTVYYNEKMCFGYDAEDWDGLNHVNSVYIPSNYFADVRIYTNVFARYIAVSYIRYGARYITYANGLNEDYKTLDYYTSTIQA